MILAGQRNPSQTLNLYTISREKLFDEKLLAIAKNYERLEELDHAMEWGLIRNPNNFTNVINSYYLWVMNKTPFNKFPQLRILFEFNKEKGIINLIDLEEIGKV